MNWGTKIILLYCGFMTMILGLVFLTLHQDIQLVSDDYYEQELKYQDKINASANSLQLDRQISFSADNKRILIDYPKEFFGKKIEGEIVFQRPSDAALDYKTNIQLNDSGQQIVLSDKFKMGLYKVQVSIKMDNKDYYFEQSLFIN